MKKKSLVPTEKGLAVYGIVKDMRIADAAMTGGWELALAKIATGEMNAFTFRKGIEVYASQITSELLKAQVGSVAGRTGAPCPRCGGPGDVLPEGRQVRKCGVRPDRIPDDSEKGAYGRPAGSLARQGTDADDRGLRQEGQGGTFEAAVVFDGDYRTAFAFEQGGKTRKPGAAKVRK